MPVVPNDVKNEILSKIKAGEQVKDLAKQYGIHNKTIYSWLRKKAIGTISLVEHNKLKRENSELKEIVGILTLELQKFKKK